MELSGISIEPSNILYNKYSLDPSPLVTFLLRHRPIKDDSSSN